MAVPVALDVTPGEATLGQGASQQFLATNGTQPAGVIWSVSATSAGSVSASGLYTAPELVTAPQSATIVATSVTNPAMTASATIQLAPCQMQMTPATATVAAGLKQIFNAQGCGPATQWSVNGLAGGSSTAGTVSASGVYTAPGIDPGAPVVVSAVSSANGSLRASASVTVVNPALPPYRGATYAGTMAGWNASMLPWIENLSGLNWDPQHAAWSVNPSWTAPAGGIAPNVYYLEEAIRPATRMAIMKQDLGLIEELAKFHTALLALRTTTIGAMLANAPANSIVFIDGAASVRTFEWYEQVSATQVRVRDCQTCNAQYLSTAARLMRAIAELPAPSRTAPMLTFVQQCSGFLVSEQLLRLMYGTTAWSHWDNPNIPQPVVSAWTFLAETGYEPPHPIKFEAAMTDMELWMVASSAEVLAADKEAPELGILNADERSQLRKAVAAGVSLIEARCMHRVAADGADVLSAFAGDYDDHPDYAYAGNTGAAQPTVPAPMAGLGWDSSHAYRFPVIFRTLYETSAATGQSFPAKSDLVALANSYVHQASNGNASLPGFSNFIDGWNGWFQAEETDIPNGYPPSEFCVSSDDPDNCLTPGTLQGWGELAFVNPDLAALSQRLIDFAYDASAASAGFKMQHYFYAGQPYDATDGRYPMLMVYVAADAAERLN
jgi:hypothetical protein